MNKNNIFKNNFVSRVTQSILLGMLFCSMSLSLTAMRRKGRLSSHEASTKPATTTDVLINAVRSKDVATLKYLRQHDPEDFRGQYNQMWEFSSKMHGRKVTAHMFHAIERDKITPTNIQLLPSDILGKIFLDSTFDENGQMGEKQCETGLRTTAATIRLASKSFNHTYTRKLLTNPQTSTTLLPLGQITFETACHESLCRIAFRFLDVFRQEIEQLKNVAQGQEVCGDQFNVLCIRIAKQINRINKAFSLCNKQGPLQKTLSAHKSFLEEERNRLERVALTYIKTLILENRLTAENMPKFFYKAAFVGHQEVVRYLCKQEELRKHITAARYKQALRKAARRGHLPVVLYLCKQAPKELRAYIDAYGYNEALREAAEFGHLSVVQYLCEQAPQRALITAA